MNHDPASVGIVVGISFMQQWATTQRLGRRGTALAGAVLLLAVVGSVRAGELDTIGITQLRSVRPDLVGAGVSVAQIEATTYNNPNDPDGTMAYDPQYDQDNFETNPSAVFTAANSPTITYVGKDNVPTTTFNLGLESGHADAVGAHYYGTDTGAAPGAAAIVSMNANTFFDMFIQKVEPLPLPLAPANGLAVSVVNQSFVFGNLSANDTAAINQLYDDYVATTGVVLVTAAGNLTPEGHNDGIQAPGSAYNVITVGDSDGGSSVGPTADGRSKPDIVAPGGATSYSTPYVSGVAAVLVQAGQTGAGGSDPATEAAAVDHRTIKALLMNGATHPAGWTNSAARPLDATFGAGVVNAFNSYENLAAGKVTPTITDATTGAAHGTTTKSEGWDLGTLTTSGSTDAVAHYLVNVAADSEFTATLVWDRAAGSVSSTSIEITSINPLELLLYDVATNALIESISTVDNVQYLYDANLPAGVYDLEVVKLAAGAVSDAETYALAFNARLLDPSVFAGQSQGGAAESGMGAVATPEPAGLSLLATGCILLMRRRQAR